MEYETSLGIFSPDGRLIQVEHSQQASEQGSLLVFTTDTQRIIVCFETKTHNRMLVESNKLFLISHKPIYMSYSGLKPDSYQIIDYAMMLVSNYKLENGEDINIHLLSYKLSSFVQAFTANMNMRPLGLRSVLFGFEDGKSFVYVIEPDGNYSLFRHGAIGQKSQKVCEYLTTTTTSGSSNGSTVDVVGLCVRGLVEVVQTDKNKIVGYEITEGGSRRLNEEEITSTGAL